MERRTRSRRAREQDRGAVTGDRIRDRIRGASSSSAEAAYGYGARVQDTPRRRLTPGGAERHHGQTTGTVEAKMVPVTWTDNAGGVWLDIS